MTTVLAIEPTPSDMRAVVLDNHGKICGRAEIALRTRSLPEGRIEQDPRALLSALVNAGRDAVSQADGGVDVVTVASRAGSVLAWDPNNGRPLSNVVVRADRRAEAVCAALHTHADLIANRTGLVLDPSRAAPKQAWLRRAVTSDGVVTGIDSWLVHQLTGEFVTDAVTAGQSLIADLRGATWDRELLALFELADEPLPAIVSCDAVVGSTIAFQDTIVVGGLVAARQAALLGAGCLDPGEATCTFAGGEASLLANLGPAPALSRAGLTTSIAWQTRHTTTYCMQGRVDTGAIRWMRQPGYIRSVADIDEVASADAGGVLAVPALSGLGAPWWRPDARASLSGMTSFTTPGHLVAAIIQGLAAQLAELGSCITRDARQLQRLRVDGALTQSHTLMQAVADLMQIEIEVSPVGRASLLGTSALARVAVDPAIGLTDALVARVPTRVHAPRWSADQAANFLGRWTLAAQSA